MTEERTIAEAAHIAIMADAVKRETAELTEANATLATEKAGLTARVEVLEAAKAQLETEKAELQKAFDDYKTETERLAAVEVAKATRLAAVKVANPALPDTHFTEERVQAWAELPEATFAVVLDGIAATSGVAPAVKETAAFSGGESPTAPTKPAGTVAGFLSVRSGRK